MKSVKNAGFSCAATTGDGQMVIGTENGDVSLYATNKKINMNAKTKFPGLGDPIIGIDVTEDGKYILGTTKQYIFVIPTEVEIDGGVNTGFNVCMGVNKPIPIKLQVSEIKNVSFTPAKFSVDGKTSKKLIISSSGSNIIVWNFEKILKGVNDYKIQKLNTKIIDDGFVRGDYSKVVIATADNISIRQISK